MTIEINNESAIAIDETVLLRLVEHDLAELTTIRPSLPAVMIGDFNAAWWHPELREVMGLQLLEGRWFDRRDAATDVHRVREARALEDGERLGGGRTSRSSCTGRRTSATSDRCGGA